MIINTTKIDSMGQVIIPIDIRGDIKEGDKLIVMRRNDEIIIKKDVSDWAILSEKSFAKAWNNKEEDEAWKDL